MSELVGGRVGELIGRKIKWVVVLCSTYQIHCSGIVAEVYGRLVNGVDLFVLVLFSAR